MLEVKHEDPNVEAFLVFIQTADAVLKFGDAFFFRHARMSIVKLMVLQILEYNGGSMTPSQIADKSLREAHGITTLVRRMQRDKLVETRRDEKDHRSVVVTLTDEGRAAIKRTTPIAKQLVDKMMFSLEKEDSIQLEKLLKVIRGNAYGEIERHNINSR